MKTTLSQLNEMVGTYVGDGINHEGQSFVGLLHIESLLDGRGFGVKFTATGNDGKVYHKEESMIATSIQDKLTLWNFNTNTPGLVPHEYRKSDAKAGVRMTKTTDPMVFGQLNHFEYYVNDLHRSNEFWCWFMPMMGYSKFQESSGGISWAHENGTYIVFVQVNDKYLSANNSRQGNGLNHIALMGKSNSHLDALQAELERRNIKILKRRANYLLFEDPNDLAVEIYSSL